jgi:hypothetical protein
LFGNYKYESIKRILELRLETVDSKKNMSANGAYLREASEFAIAEEMVTI